LIEQVHEETPATLDRPVPLDKVDSKAARARLVCLGQLVQKDPLERLDFRVALVSLDILEYQATQVQLDFWVHLVNLEARANLALQDQMDLQDLQDKLGLLVPWALWVLLALPDRLDCLEQLDSKVHVIVDLTRFCYLL